MSRHFSPKASVLLTALLFGTVTGSLALSQPPPPGPGGPGGGPGGPGFGRGPRGGPRQASAVQTPLAALAAELKLTDDQKSQIKAIQDNVKKQRQTLMPRPNPNGERPDPETMRANFDKMRAMEQKANKDIEAVLNDTQKQALPVILKQFDNLRMGGIPLEVYGDLKLTSDQKQQIGDIVKKARAAMAPPPDGGQPGAGGPPPGEGGQPGAGGPPRGPGGRGPGGMFQKTREQVMAVLTDDQKKIVQDYLEAHPRQRFGPGGPGGPGGFGGPGGPPPGGGPGGPPPPGDGGPGGQDAGVPPPPGDGYGNPPPPGE